MREDKDWDLDVAWQTVGVQAGFHRLFPMPTGILSKEHAMETGAFALGGTGKYYMPNLSTAVARAVAEGGHARSGSNLKFFANLHVESGFHGPRRELGAFIFREKSTTAMADIICLAHQIVLRLTEGRPAVSLFMKKGEKADELMHMLAGVGMEASLVSDLSAEFLFEIHNEGGETLLAKGGLNSDLLAKVDGPNEPMLEAIIYAEPMQSAMEESLVKAMRPTVLVGYMDDGVRADAFCITWQLRQDDIPTVFVYRAKNIGRQLKEAADLEVKVIVIVGGEEWDRGEVEVRNFRTREKKSVPVGDVLEEVQDVLENEAVLEFELSMDEDADKWELDEEREKNEED